jgi:hypothetical protein
MGCNCGKRAGLKYQVLSASNQPVGDPKDTIGEAQQAVRAGEGAGFKAVKG